MEQIRLINEDDQKVVIGFSGRVSADNANDIEDALVGLREKHSKGRLVFDFEKLEYISRVYKNPLNRYYQFRHK